MANAVSSAVTSALTKVLKNHALVAENVYIGSRESVRDEKFLKKHGIRFIVNASNKREHMNALGIPTIIINDILDVDMTGQKVSELTVSFVVDITHKLKSAAAQIDYIVRKYSDDSDGGAGVAGSAGETNAKCNVLVHCEAGVNRSASVIATYLKLYRGYTADEAITAIEKANNTRFVPALNNMMFRHIIRSIEKDTSVGKPSN